MRCPDDRLRVLICGAAHGLGLACAELFAATGAELFLVDCDSGPLAAAARRLAAAYHRCDSISDADVAGLTRDLVGRFPAVDVLINAAGRGFVRSLSMVRMSHAILPLMAKSGGQGTIFNIASLEGFRTADGIFPYASSLAAWRRLSKAVTRNASDFGVRVVNVVPAIDRPGRRRDCPADKIHRLLRVDEPRSALRILAHLAAGRALDAQPRVA